MKRSQYVYPARHMISSLLMVVTLLWLTVSTPFVFKAQQEQKKEIEKQSKLTDTSNPFSNTTEEKNESGANTLSEYLHVLVSVENDFITIKRLYIQYPSKIYFEHHPELISPPPEA